MTTLTQFLATNPAGTYRIYGGRIPAGTFLETDIPGIVHHFGNPQILQAQIHEEAGVAHLIERHNMPRGRSIVAVIGPDHD